MSLISEKVANLLIEFYTINFNLHSQNGAAGEQIVNLVINCKGEFNQEIRDQINQLFASAGRFNRSGIVEPKIIDLFDLSKVKSFVDIGANRVNLINYLSKKYTSIDEFIAIDTIPQFTKFYNPLKSRYIQVDDNNLEVKYPIKDQTIDFINISNVLHHMGNKDYIRQVILECKRILTHEGRLIITEESFQTGVEIEAEISKSTQMGFCVDKNLTREFYNLDLQERLEFIRLNDLIINTNNPHMQWSGEWRSWEEWIRIFLESGFVLEESFNLGLRANGKLKQGVNIEGLFKIK